LGRAVSSKADTRIPHIDTYQARVSYFRKINKNPILRRYVSVPYRTRIRIGYVSDTRYACALAYPCNIGVNTSRAAASSSAGKNKEESVEASHGRSSGAQKGTTVKAFRPPTLASPDWLTRKHPATHHHLATYLQECDGSEQLEAQLSDTASIACNIFNKMSSRITH
jgi:hypothetical protein